MFIWEASNSLKVFFFYFEIDSWLNDQRRTQPRFFPQKLINENQIFHLNQYMPKPKRYLIIFWVGERKSIQRGNFSKWVIVEKATNLVKVYRNASTNRR
jgi:hypothetical protein